MWVEWASRERRGSGAEGDVIRVHQSEERFCAVMASHLPGTAAGKADQVADGVERLLERGLRPESVLDQMVDAHADGQRMPFSIVDVRADDGSDALNVRLAQCDAPPVLVTRWDPGAERHALFLPPVIEDSYRGCLVRRCQFGLQDRDHLAVIGEGYFRGRGWTERWVWKDIATYTRRWTATGCSAEQLVDALMSTYDRRRVAAAIGEASTWEMRPVSALAAYVRPARSVTVWTGPPADGRLDEVALSRLMCESGTRVICGDTTAKIAAQLLEEKLELGSRPPGGWREVPPVLRLKGVDLVTEGLVTMGRALDLLSGGRRESDLPRVDDGATRLARALLGADSVHFVVGMGVNPQQVDASGLPLRRGLVEGMVDELRNRGTVVAVDCL